MGGVKSGVGGVGGLSESVGVIDGCEVLGHCSWGMLLVFGVVVGVLGVGGLVWGV